MTSASQDRAHRLSEAYWKKMGPERKFLSAAKHVGEEIPATAIARKVLSNAIGRQIHEYERRGFVEHIVSPPRGENDYSPLDPKLEDDLRKKFRLRDAVVVNVPEDDDDLLHKKLGKWGGRILSSLVRPDDVIGVGSGRAVALTASSCIVPVDRHRPKQIVSLTGNMTVQLWDSSESPPLDADVIVGLLANRFQPTGGTTPVGARIVDPANEPARKRLEINQSTTNLAVIGIGALAGGHRLLRFDPTTVHDELKPVEKEVEKLLKLVKRLDPPAKPGGREHHWCGDICNGLFVVEDSATNGSLRKEDRKSLVRAVHDLNGRFINTEPKHLAEIAATGVVLAICGGKHKLAAIHHALSAFHRENQPWITHIVTNVQVAERLLEIEQGKSGGGT